MKKRYRFLIILAVIAVGLYFVWPTVRWYFLTPQVDKDIAESSRNQIKVYAQERADEAIKKLVAMDPTATLPTEYSFLITKASCALQDGQQERPRRRGRCRTSCRPIPAAADIATDAEDWYRSQMFALKDLKNQTMQLGLDLRGGMYVTVRMDFAAWRRQRRGPQRRAARRQGEDDAGSAQEQDRPVRSHRPVHPHAGDRQDHHRDPRHLGS